MLYKILEEETPYDGSQLNPDFSYQTGLIWDNIISFKGPARVKEHLVDLEDSLNNDFIKSDEMLHFIITLSGNSIIEAVLWQRIFIHIIANFIRTITDKKILVNGDDIFIEDGKLSVSIATVSPTKELIHIGINWDAGEDTPVKVANLKNLQSITFKDFMEAICSRISNEYEDIKKATFKVKTF